MGIETEKVMFLENNIIWGCLTSMSSYASDMTLEKIDLENKIIYSYGIKENIRIQVPLDSQWMEVPTLNQNLILKTKIEKLPGSVSKLKLYKYLENDVLFEEILIENFSNISDHQLVGTRLKYDYNGANYLILERIQYKKGTPVLKIKTNINIEIMDNDLSRLEMIKSNFDH